VMFGIFALFWFVDRPRDAKWLSVEEKDWVEAEIAKDDAEAAQRSGGRTGWLPILTNPMIWCCCGVWLAFVSGGNGIIFWLPQAIKAIGGGSDLQASLLSALPWVAFGAGVWLNARHSDQTQERFLHVGFAALLGAVGLAAAAVAGPTALALVFLIVGGLGLGGGHGAFWTVPMRLLSGTQGANGVAIINLTGNIGSLVMPAAIGMIVQRTGSFQAPTYVLAGLLLLGTLLLIPVARADRHKTALAHDHGA
jgi:MFS transporter, ACS family, tartrate transporter